MQMISSTAIVRTGAALCLVLAANAGLSEFSGTATAQGTARSGAISSAETVRPTYADLADLGTIAPIVIVGEITEVIPLKPAQAPGVAPGFVAPTSPQGQLD